MEKKKVKVNLKFTKKANTDARSNNCVNNIRLYNKENESEVQRGWGQKEAGYTRNTHTIPYQTNT